MNKLLSSKGFLAAPIDEIDLHKKSQKILSENKPIDIDQINRNDGLNIATSVLYQQILASKHSDFIQAIDRQSISNTIDSTPNKIKCLIIPGMFYKEHPEAGSDGSLIESICKKNGFETELILTHSKGSVTDNKEIIKQSIQQQTHENIWLISISKGTADVHAYLQELTTTPSKIKGWISFSGIFEGASLASQRTNRLDKKILLKLLCKFMSVDYKAIDELRLEHPYWNNLKASFKNINLIHIVGFPLLPHVHPLIARRFKKLSKNGPTDGIIDLKNIINYPGQIYPVWGCDHFLRSNNNSALLYKLCHYMKNQPNQAA